MGCISSNEVKNPKKYKSNNQNQNHVQASVYRQKKPKQQLTKSKVNQNNHLNNQTQQQLNYETTKSPRNKIRSTTSSQFLSTYTIQQTLLESAKMQGPKLIVNKIDGAVKVLRVYHADKINEERMKIYQNILNFQLFTDQQANILLIDSYAAGKSIVNLALPRSNQQQSKELSGSSSSNSVQNLQKIKIFNMLLQIYDTIIKFHSNKTYLGNLNIFSFKYNSQFDDEIRLIEFNLSLEQLSHNEHESMGHAHRNSFQSDWQFYGYLLFFYLCSNKSPIFITHKMQYIPSSQSELNPKLVSLISSLLKGKQISRKQVQQIDLQYIKTTNQNVLYGYMFCKDVLRLIRARHRRQKHLSSYYSEQILISRSNNQLKNNQNPQNQYYELKGVYFTVKQISIALSEQNLHRLQTERIFSRIQKYIQYVNGECEQHFVNYSANGQNFSKKLKQVFLLQDPVRKMDQFKELLPQIK